MLIQFQSSRVCGNGIRRGLPFRAHMTEVATRLGLPRPRFLHLGFAVSAFSVLLRKLLKSLGVMHVLTFSGQHRAAFFIAQIRMVVPDFP